MNWYIVKIIFRIISGAGNHAAQFDEQLRLIASKDEASAFEKAAKIGLAGQDSFLNANKEMVKWEFIAVTEINAVTALEDGAELYYNLYETKDAEAYIALTRKKLERYLYAKALIN